MKDSKGKSSRIKEGKTVYGMPAPSMGALTVREAAALCGKDPETVRRWVWSGKIRAEKVGNQLFIERSQLEKSCYKARAKEKTGKADWTEIIQRIDMLRERIREETGGRSFDVSELIEESRASRDS